MPANVPSLAEFAREREKTLRPKCWTCGLPPAILAEVNEQQRLPKDQRPSDSSISAWLRAQRHNIGDAALRKHRTNGHHNV